MSVGSSVAGIPQKFGIFGIFSKVPVRSIYTEKPKREESKEQHQKLSPRRDVPILEECRVY